MIGGFNIQPSIKEDGIIKCIIFWAVIAIAVIISPIYLAIEKIKFVFNGEAYKTIGFWYFVGSGIVFTSLLAIKLWWYVFEKFLYAKKSYIDYLSFVLHRKEFEAWQKREF